MRVELFHVGAVKYTVYMKQIKYLYRYVTVPTKEVRAEAFKLAHLWIENNYPHLSKYSVQRSQIFQSYVQSYLKTYRNIEAEK